MKRRGFGRLFLVLLPLAVAWSPIAGCAVVEHYRGWNADLEGSPMISRRSFFAAVAALVSLPVFGSRLRSKNAQTSPWYDVPAGEPQYVWSSAGARECRDLAHRAVSTQLDRIREHYAERTPEAIARYQVFTESARAKGPYENTPWHGWTP